MQFRPRPSAAQDRNTYIPPSVQQAMNQQLQQSAPAHLKKYVGTGAYVPQHAQKALQQHLQKTAPGHLKQYAGAYIQQNVAQPGLVTPAAPQATPNKAPAPNPLRLDHSNVPGSQYEAQFNELFQPDQPSSPPAQTYQAQNGQAQPNPQQPYDFILNPDQPKRSFRLPGGENKIVRIAFVLGGLLIILVIFSILKSLLSSGPDYTPYVAVAQDQQSLMHLTQSAAKQPDLSVVNLNYTSTAKLSLSSAQNKLLAYLNKQHKKVNGKTLNLKVSTSDDKQLTDAQAGGTFNQTYHDLAEAKLKAYINDLNHAYNTSSGKNGRALLKDDYAQAQLLLKQINAPAT